MGNISVLAFLPSKKLKSMIIKNMEGPEREEVKSLKELMGNVPTRIRLVNAGRMIDGAVEDFFIDAAKEEACHGKSIEINDWCSQKFSGDVEREILSRRLGQNKTDRYEQISRKLYRELCFHLLTPVKFIWGEVSYNSEAINGRGRGIVIKLNEKAADLFKPPDYSKILTEKEGWEEH